MAQREVIPGWEWSLTFEFSDKNAGEYMCETSDGEFGEMTLEAIGKRGLFLLLKSQRLDWTECD